MLTLVLRQLLDWTRKYSKMKILLTSRPAAITYSFSGFSIFNLSAFSQIQIKQLIFKLASQWPKEELTKFQNAIFQTSYLADLATNPLLLRLLWTVFELRTEIPSNPTFLYSDFTDYLLSTWDSAKGIGARSSLTLYERHILLEKLALQLDERDQTSFDLEDFHHTFNDYSAFKLDKEELIAALNWISTSGLLIREKDGRFCFIHKSFLEYYIARAIRRNPKMVIRFIDQQDKHNIIIFACGLINDVAPIVEEAINRRFILLAAKCLSNGRTQNHELSVYVASELTREIGRPFIDLLIDLYSSKASHKTSAPDYVNILDFWERANNSNNQIHSKGKYFEDFAEKFFGSVFNVVSRDLNTENGELDLIIELGLNEPFWMEFGGDALIECKNWDSHVPLKEVGAFIAKVAQARVKLSFIVSVSGFTEDAVRSLKNNASNVSAPLIVPIDGVQIKTALLRGEVLEEFFKDTIRRLKYLRKY